jgi:hypothetical protein
MIQILGINCFLNDGSKNAYKIEDWGLHDSIIYSLTQFHTVVS